MLVLKGIVKHYETGGQTVAALQGIQIAFRKSEFVSVLGPSGCGKTTLLNIIGGLDQYTSGDLSINGKSTKHFKDADWDTYRNHSIGFVFQSYNLIQHQSVLANVELALTLSGVSASERRARAEAVLKKVGLENHLHKRPNQLSGGQMQRVAIARALINNPDILLADEPTGALDTETSVQVMEILKEISKDRLVIMVTHNPDLAEKYSTRIVRLLDGKIIGDSNPYNPHDQAASGEAAPRKRSMRFTTALSLSLNNLLTKKARTILTAFAGSIGIIGIALILSLSSGFQAYINNVEQDSLSTYPISIEEESVDFSVLVSSMMGATTEEVSHDMDKVYSNNMMQEMVNAMLADIQTNDLAQFKAFLDENPENINDLVTAIQYNYAVDLNIYGADTSDGLVQVNPSTVFEKLTGSSSVSEMMSMSSSMGMAGGSGTDLWQELLGNQELLESQYDVIAGRWPSAYNEVVLVVDENNEISDLALYTLGLKDQDDLPELMEKMNNKEQIDSTQVSYTYDEILNLTFKLVPSAAYYEKDEATGLWVDRREDEDFVQSLVEDGVELQVVGILRPSESATATSLNGAIGYTSALTQHVIDLTDQSEIVQAQLADPDTNVFTGLPFGSAGEAAAFDPTTLPEEQQQYLATLSPQEQAEFLSQYGGQSAVPDTYEEVLDALGVVDPETPSAILIYPVDFESKDQVAQIIDDYNAQREAAGEEESVITYTDYIGLMISSITTIVNVISYVLIAFVAISLVVSSIMIGIITYISVLERTKEIGILRAIGASKRDISRVFNAETLIIGFAAGAMGILITVLLCIPANAIIQHLAGIYNVAKLPVLGGIILVLISMFLTFIAGLIPSRIAAKKDPVVALRTE